MKISALNLNTDHFTIEHLQDSPANSQLIEGFAASNNAMGLEAYLKLRNVADLVGVKCLYIYALPEEKLIRYYNSLGFVRLPLDAETFVHTHVKPAYDQGCIFMYQEV